MPLTAVPLVLHRRNLAAAPPVDAPRQRLRLRLLQLPLPRAARRLAGTGRWRRAEPAPGGWGRRRRQLLAGSGQPLGRPWRGRVRRPGRGRLGRGAAGAAAVFLGAEGGGGAGPPLISRRAWNSAQERSENRLSRACGRVSSRIGSLDWLPGCPDPPPHPPQTLALRGESSPPPGCRPAAAAAHHDSGRGGDAQRLGVDLRGEPCVLNKGFLPQGLLQAAAGGHSLLPLHTSPQDSPQRQARRSRQRPPARPRIPANPPLASAPPAGLRRSEHAGPSRTQRGLAGRRSLAAQWGQARL